MDDDLIREATEASDYDQARILFLEYADQFGLDLEYLAFDLELDNLESMYCKPRGSILLIRDEVDIENIGIAALSSFNEECIELKRLFIKREKWSYALGESLLQSAIEMAKEMNFKKIILDTLPDMGELVDIYESNGFKKVEAFREDPFPGTLFYSMDLSS